MAGTCLERSIYYCYKNTLVFCLILFSNTAWANDSTLYFYQGYNYGTEAVFNPLTTIINGGSGILQISNRSNDLSRISFRQGLKNVSFNLSHPIRAIERLGWRNFLSREVFPASIRLKNAQYYPNYYNHLIGGGFTYRAFVDWFHYHQFPVPRVMAFTSWFSYHFLNEIVENNAYSGYNVDPVSDMYIFNTAGLILFSSDRVSRFFAHTLNMRDWSFMPAYDPWLRTIENNGQNFMTRIRIPALKRWSLMYHWGVHGMYGISHHRRDGNTYSISGGLVVKDLVAVNQESGVRELTATLVWTSGLFWDRNGVLLSSLILSGTKGYKVRLNIYPGVIKVARFSPGLSFTLRKDNAMVVTLHHSWSPIGLAKRIKK